MNSLCPDCSTAIPEGFSHDCPGPGPATRELVAKLERHVDRLGATAKKADQFVLKKVTDLRKRIDTLERQLNDVLRFHRTQLAGHLKRLDAAEAQITELLKRNVEETLVLPMPQGLEVEPCPHTTIRRHEPTDPFRCTACGEAQPDPRRQF